MVNDMTTEEKRLFAECILEGPQGSFLKSQEKSIRSNRITTAIGAAGIVAAGIFFKINLAYFLPIAFIGGAVIHVFGWLGSRMAINKVLSGISAGKVSYKEYKQLVKSGELEKWLTAEKEKTNQTNVENKGEQLTPEELAVLKKLIQKQENAKVEEIVETTPVETTKTPDQGRNS